jgi:uncharacterized protein YndB with AHSA1/START domain
VAAHTAGSSNALTVDVLSDLEIVLRRTFDAPRALVFKTMTDPALIPNWWGPHGYTTIVEKMEVRPGGEWRFVHRAPNGRETAFHGVYREIAPPERLVYTFEWEGMPGHVSTETVRFEERDGKTTMINTVRYASVEDRDGVLNSGMQKGAAETMDRLAMLVEEQGPAKAGRHVHSV